MGAIGVSGVLPLPRTWLGDFGPLLPVLPPPPLLELPAVVLPLAPALLPAGTAEAWAGWPGGATFTAAGRGGCGTTARDI